MMTRFMSVLVKLQQIENALNLQQCKRELNFHFPCVGINFIILHVYISVILFEEVQILTVITLI